jgi:hypothetical protein
MLGERKGVVPEGQEKVDDMSRQLTALAAKLSAHVIYFLLSLRDDPERVPCFQRFNRYVDAHGRPPHGNAEGLEKARTGWNPGNQSLQGIPNISKFGSAVFRLL